MLIQSTTDLNTLAWHKGQDHGDDNKLLPAIVQDAFDGRVLMQAFMNPEALRKSLDTGRVTFWSRSRQVLWTKGETSNNFLNLVSVHADCDLDSLLIQARPQGPSCHLQTATCWDQDEAVFPALGFLAELERLIETREQDRPAGSYTTRLFEAGTKRIAQKVGEEGVETALAAAVGDREELVNESADLLYHLLVLLRDSGLSFDQVVATLRSRHG